jgi:hypothetical protein
MPWEDIRTILAQCIIYYFFPFEQDTSYQRSCRRNLKKRSFNWKLEWLVPFLIFESDWKATNTPFMPTISKNTFNQNFEIAMLFNVVESSGNSVLKDDNHHNKP